MLPGETAVGENNPVSFTPAPDQTPPGGVALVNATDAPVAQAVRSGPAFTTGVGLITV